MHPLTTFPILLAFGLVAPLLLRIVTGVFIWSIGWDRYHKPMKLLSAAYAIFGALIIMGLYTQISAIVSAFLIWIDFAIDKKSALVTKEKKMLYVLMTVVLLSLIFTGPGFYAFDLPL